MKKFNVISAIGLMTVAFMGMGCVKIYAEGGLKGKSPWLDQVSEEQTEPDDYGMWYRIFNQNPTDAGAQIERPQTPGPQFQIERTSRPAELPHGIMLINGVRT